MASLRPGIQLAKYRLERVLGRGGMGEVWAAYDPDLDRRVALKVVHARLGGDEAAHARFQREGRAMARLRHPNVIVVHDATFIQGRGLIAMELIDGENLSTWVGTQRPADELVGALVAAGRGLAAAHAAGMVHRDFKPHNVLVDRDGRIVVTDFGLARATNESPSHAPRPRGDSAPSRPSGLAETATARGLDETATPSGARGLDATAAPGLDETATPSGACELVALDETSRPSALDTTVGPGGLDTTVASEDAEPSRPSGVLGTPLTATGALLGTPAYMAPEQLAGRPADAQADQYAFCVTAWELLAGERPFHGGTFPELIASVERGVPNGADRVPRALRPILLRGLSRDPARRWPAMDPLLAAIERAWRRPRRLALGAGAAAVLAAAASVAVAARPTATTGSIGCGGPAEAVASAWSPAIRADFAARLAGKPYAARALAFLDRWATKWQQVHAENCAAPASPDFDTRRTCLETIRDDVSIIMEHRAEIPLDTFSAPDMPRLIPTPEACRHDPRGLAPAPPADHATRAEVAKIRGDLAAKRMLLLGRSKLARFADMKPELERARATNYAPVIIEAQIMNALAEAGTSGKGLGETCDDYRNAARDSEAAGYQRMVVDALMLEHRCLMGLGQREEGIAILERLERIVQRTQNPLHLAEVAMIRAPFDRLEGDYDKALAAITGAQERYRELQMDDWAFHADFEAAKALAGRHGPGDLERAADLLRTLAAHAKAERKAIIAELREVEWYRGKIADAPPLPGAPVVELAGAIALAIRVTDERGPAAGVQLAAARDLQGDATRLATDHAPSVTAATDANGTARLIVAAGALILARAGDRIGVAAAPARAGTVAIRLGPAAALSGTVAIDPPRPGAATDPVVKASRRLLATVFVTTEIEGRPISWTAPVGTDGRWSLPAIVPGMYRLVAQADSPADGHIVQATLEARPGANEAPPLAMSAAQSIGEVIVRPSSASLAIAFTGDGPPPATWDQLRARVAGSPEVSISLVEQPTLRDRDTRRTDGIGRIAMTARAITVCAVTFELADERPWTRLAGASDEPPLCRTATLDERAITRIVISPR